MSAFRALPASALCYCFDLPDRNMSVYLDQQFIRDLHACLTLLRSEGKTTFDGLLLGSVDATSQPTTVLVESFVAPVEWQSRQRKRPSIDPRRLMGWFVVSDSAVESVRRPDSVISPYWALLHIQAVGNAVPIAELTISTSFSSKAKPDLRFLFDAAELSQLASPSQGWTPMPEMPKLLPATSESGAEAKAALPAAAGQLRHARWRYAVAGGLLAAVAAGAFLIPSLVRRNAQPAAARATPGGSNDTSALGIRVLLHGRQVNVNWDRTAVERLEALHGVLQVRDGEQFRDVSLGQQQLTRGSVAYVARTDDLDFHLQFTSRSGDVFSESLKVIGADAASGTLTATSSVPALSEPPARPAPATARFEESQRSRTFALPAAPPRGEAAAPQLSEPLPLTAPLGDNNVAHPALTAGLDGVLSSGKVHTAPVIALTPAVLLSRTPVQVPQAVRTMQRDQSIMVGLRIRIDATGKVVAVAPQSKESGLAQMLSASVADAVRNWKFRPAQRDGRPIESEQDLQVVVKL